MMMMTMISIPKNPEFCVRHFCANERQASTKAHKKRQNDKRNHKEVLAMLVDVALASFNCLKPKCGAKQMRNAFASPSLVMTNVPNQI